MNRIPMVLAVLLALAAGCTTRQPECGVLVDAVTGLPVSLPEDGPWEGWELNVSDQATSEWKEHRSYYALQEILDTEMMRRLCNPKRRMIEKVLGPPDTIDYPGTHTNTVAYESQRKTFRIVDLLLTYDTNDNLVATEWLARESLLWSWGRISLPLCAESPADRRDKEYAYSRRVDIAIDRSGAIFLGMQRSSTESLLMRVTSLQKRYGTRAVPVVIASDRDTPFERVWPVVRAVQETGIWELSFKIRHENEGTGTGIVDFLVPIREGDSKHKGPVILKSDATNEMVTVRVHPDGYQINDKAGVLKAEALEEQLKGIASGAKTKAVIILPQAGVTHQQVVTLMGISRRSGLKSCYIVDE